MNKESEEKQKMLTTMRSMITFGTESLEKQSTQLSEIRTWIEDLNKLDKQLKEEIKSLVDQGH